MPLNSLSKHTVIHCGDPETEIWRTLRLLATPSYATSSLLGVHGEHLGRRLLADKAADFARAVQQAREYFQASESVTSATAPVLCYYGMLSLATGLAIFRERSLTLRAVPRGHGLEACDLPACRDILDSSCCLTQRGLFPLLARQGLPDWVTITAHQSTGRLQLPLPPTSHALGLHHGSAWASTGHRLRFTLRALVARLPDLSAELWTHPGIGFWPVSCALSLHRVADSDVVSAQVRLSADEPTRLAEAAAVVERESPQFAVTSEGSGYREYETEALADPLQGPLPCFRDSTGGQTYLVYTTDPAVPETAEILDWLGAGFLLASLARYCPQVWLGKPAAAPETMLVVETFIRMCRRRFPHLVLNALYERYFRFVS
jgi:hypothetical protein